MVNKPKCSIAGCNNNALRNGNPGKKGQIYYHPLCTKHHKAKYGMSYEGSFTRKRRDFPNEKCVLCDWEGPCDRHRLLMGSDGGEYSKGNVIILCPNCHRLLHKGKLTIKQSPLLEVNKVKENELG